MANNTKPSDLKIRSDGFFMHKAFFYFFLFILAIAPLPLGSNRPFFWHFLSLSIFLLSSLWLLAFLLNKTSLTSSFRSAQPLVIGFIIWLVYLYLQVSFQSPLSSTSIDISYDFFLRSLSLFLFFCLSLVLINSKQRMITTAWVIVLSGAFQAFYGSIMTLSGWEYGFFTEKEFYRGVATGTFVNRNHLAGFLEMTLAVGFGLLLANLSEESFSSRSFKQKARNILKWVFSAKMQLRILLAIMVIGLVLTHSRMGNSAFFTSLTVAGLLWLLIEKKKPKKSVIILLVSLFIIDIVIVGTWFGVQEVAERLENTTTMGESRDEVVRDGLVYFKDYVWFGSGAGTFEYVFPKYRQADISLNYDYAHNDFLQFAVETGMFGILILGFIVSTVIWKSIKMIKSDERSIQKGMALACFMAVLSIMIHSSVDFNLQIPANSLLFILILSLPFIKLNKQRSKY